MFSQLVINALLLAGTYGLVALGLTLIFGVMQTVNFAHGQFLMLGAYLALLLTPHIGYLAATVCAAVAVGILGIFTERLAFRPFRGQIMLKGLVASLAFGIILQNTAEVVWGTAPRFFRTSLTTQILELGTLGISYQRIAIIVVSFSIMGLMYWFIEKTDLGRKMRAVAEDPEIAGAMGINADHVFRIAFFIASGLAAIAGSLYGPADIVAPDMGGLSLQAAFAIVILGGFGNIQGTLIASLIVGAIQSVTAVYISNAYSMSVTFLFLLIMLSLFPTGIVRERSEENV